MAHVSEVAASLLVILEESQIGGMVAIHVLCKVRGCSERDSSSYPR